jgi:thiopeptide-type bacteriocin biosynthesis protein
MKASNFLLLRTPLQSLSLAFAELPFELSPMFHDGIRHAAPAFYEEFKKNGASSGKEKKKIQDSLYKYWLRSCTRCTPYGFFAGNTIIDIQREETSIVLDKQSSNKVQARLDIGYLTMLRTKIETLDSVKRQLRYSINDTLYQTAADFRYIEYVLEQNFRRYKLSSIERTDYLEFIFEFAKDYVTIGILSKKIQDHFDVKLEEAIAFVEDLINCQALVSELNLTLTGVDPLFDLINKIDCLEGADDVVSGLKKIDCFLDQINRDNYENVEQQVLDVFSLPGIHGSIINIDLSKPAIENQISKALVDEIVNQANDLQPLSRLHSNRNLENFVNRFIERYEDAEVPLTVALDSDLGIGYGEESSNDEWIEGIQTFVSDNQNTIHRDFITSYTCEKFQHYLTNQKKEIEITQEDLLKFPKKDYKFSVSSYLFGSLFHDRKLGEDNFSFFLNISSVSPAATILGRFTLGDDILSKLAKSTLETEESVYPDAIFAEITHIPQAKAGNIIVRSCLRKYEIPYLGNSGVEHSCQIPVSDIVVSVRENEVILRSIKHNKRIFPRLSSSHDFYGDNLPVYRFLCELQFQKLAIPNVWDWGVFRNEKHLPRVRYKNLILKKEKWVFKDIEIKNFPLPTEIHEFMSAIGNFRTLNGMPKLISINEGDNNLLIDLENPNAAALFIDLIKRKKTITVEEFLFSEDNCVVKDINGLPFTNEMIIPVIRDVAPNTSEKTVKIPTVRRKFPPGSDCLYIKIYGGEKTLEKILIDALYPFIIKSMEKNCIEKFFFIRYADPDRHLRLRFFTGNSAIQSDFQKQIMEILEPYLSSEQIYKIMIDTYVRELERYSEELIIESESIFFNDSLCTLKLNSLLMEVEEPQKYRLMLAMRDIDSLLNDFNLELTEKMNLSESMSASFMQEFGSSPQLKRMVDEKYRKIQREIFSVMDERQDRENEIEEAVAIFAVRSRDNEEVIGRIMESLVEEKDRRRLHILLRDYIHMLMNRLFTIHQRKYELLIYSFLNKYYSSQFAIQKKMRD